MLTPRMRFPVLIIIALFTCGWGLNSKANAAIPGETAPAMRLAYIQQKQLYLQDVNTSQPAEYKIALSGQAEIIGWSPDGNWLALQQWTAQGKGPYLWVVNKTGGEYQQLAANPVNTNAGWAPKGLMLAYSTIQTDASVTTEYKVVLSELRAGKWINRELIPASSEKSHDLTWFPDGQALALSLSRTLDEPPRVDKINLHGKRKRLVTLRGKDLGDLGDDNLFVNDLTSLTFSPNGRYIAAFLASNSTFYNAITMPLSIIDTRNNHRWVVGKGLGYRGWLAWSGDNKKLAFINGMGRSATTNKRLWLAQVGKKVKVIKVGKKGLVDCRPGWFGQNLYFARGVETETWDTTDKRIPGQQIVRFNNGKVSTITTPGTQDSDYPLSLAPSGQYLAFLRCSSSEQARLYIVNLKTMAINQVGEPLRGTGGYYGNFYPDWVYCYWLSNQAP